MNLMRTIITLLLLGLCARGTFAITLEEAIHIGKQRSLNMQDPRIERLRVSGQINEAWSNALPQIEGTAGYQRYWKPAKIFFPNPMTGQIEKLQMQQDNNAIGEISLNQPLYTFGRVAAGLKAAYAAKRANDHLQRNTDRAVELEVMRRYWTVLLMRDVVAARKSSVAISDSSLVRVERMRDLGLMSDYDVLRTRVQAANQIPPLKQAENSLHLSELSLREFLGVPLDSAVSADGTLDSYIREDAIDAVEATVLKRDDLEALREVNTMYRNIYTIYRNAHWPVLGGQLKYSWQWSNDDWDINPRNNMSSVYGGIAVTIPILSSGKTKGRAQQAKADWQRARLDLEKSERGATLQYESAVRTYRTALTSEQAAVTAVQQAEEARRIAQTKLAQGQITTLEMDAAQLDELVARVALAQAHYDRLIAAAEARMAAGRAPFAK